MKNDEIKITVLMPAYNASNYIEEAIESVLKQTFSEFELLIIDDGSTDNTADIVRSFNDSRIVFIRQSNGGVASALNNGLQHARAEYIARFDADDICYANRLKTQYEFVMKNPEYIVVGSGADYVDANGDFVFSYDLAGYTDEQIKNLSYSVCPFIHSTVLLRKSVFLGVGGYNEHAHSFEDHFLWSQIKEKGKFYNLSQSLIKVRLNPESVTVDEKWRLKEFINIKYKVLKELHITPEDGQRLLEVLKLQNNKKIKMGSYYALLAKKFLWNNYQPALARKNIIEAIKLSPFHVNNYSVLIMSYLPHKMISKIYTVSKKREE